MLPNLYTKKYHKNFWINTKIYFYFISDEYKSFYISYAVNLKEENFLENKIEDFNKNEIELLEKEWNFKKLTSKFNDLSKKI